MNKAKRYYLAMVFLLIFHSAAFANSNTANKIVRVARGEIGKGETIANNAGRDVEKYLRTPEHLSWCAGFVSYCLKAAGVEIKYTLRALEFVNYGRQLAIIELQVGDIVIFKRKGGGHIGIIESIKDNSFISIEGNVGKFPAKVKRVEHKFFEENIYRFVRIQ